MSFTISDFLKSVDEINKNNYDYGNDVLYSAFNFCNGILPWPQGNIDTRLSSAMSVIGKSYSADPTRSAPKGVLKNNGTGDAFKFLAEKMVIHTDYKTFYDKVKALSSKEFSYTSTDKNILIDTIFCVALLNHILRDIINTVNADSADKESKNTISFCSKFLHFLCPNTVFIKDSISLENGRSIFKNLSLTINAIDIKCDFDPKEKMQLKNTKIMLFVHIPLQNSCLIMGRCVVHKLEGTLYLPRICRDLWIQYL